MIYKTVDSGKSWNKNTVNPYGQLQSLKFTNQMIGYSIVDSTLYKTIDGGIIWSVIDSNNYVRGLSALDSLEIWTASGSVIKHSLDGGISWEETNFDSLFIDDIYFFNNNFGLLYNISKTLLGDSSNLILITEDGGKSWQKNYLPENITGLEKVLFIMMILPPSR